MSGTEVFWSIAAFSVVFMGLGALLGHQIGSLQGWSHGFTHGYRRGQREAAVTEQTMPDPVPDLVEALRGMVLLYDPAALTNPPASYFERRALEKARAVLAGHSPAKQSAESALRDILVQGEGGADGQV